VRRWIIAAALLVSGLLAHSPRAHASPQDLFGFGGRTPGMAMTGSSYSCDYEAVYANPAGLACAERRAFVLGFSAGAFDVSVDGERYPITPSRGMTLGFQLPLPFGGPLEDRIVLGGAFFTPSEVVLRGEVKFPDIVQFPVLERSQVVAIQVGTGIDLYGLVDGLTIGGGFSALADLVGDLFVRLNEENEFSSQVETQLLTSFAPIWGARYTRDEWAVGVTFRHELESHMSLDIVTADLPVEVPPLMLGGLVQYDPHTLVVEGNWKPADGWMLVANATVRFWSAWPGLQRRATTSSPLAPEPEFSDTISPRVAVERTVRDGDLEVALRGGYAYEPSPAPPARMAPLRERFGMGEEVPLRMVDNDRHVVTAGVGLAYRVGDVETIRVDLYGQLQLMPSREHDIPASSTSTSNMETSGLMVAGGWVVAAEF